MITLPVMNPYTKSFVRLWRRKIHMAVTMHGMNTNLQALVSYIVPENLEPLLQGHTSLDALLDIVCHHYEKEVASSLSEVIRQEKFLFIRVIMKQSDKKPSIPRKNH
ncbi:hypothetical protein NEAUS03_1591 [Nematocida ausubeli]|nr:hypothetical protein NEAUS03_1591 [Nematocida ausubeli]